MEPIGAAKGRRTQWASQFLAAAELVRRNYVVSFTMGNSTPIADLMVGTQGGQQFWVDVKGRAGKSDWLITPKPTHHNLFYILVYLSPLANSGEGREADQFFVLTQAEANRLEEEFRADRPGQRTTIPGFRFGAAIPHRDRWDKLPSDQFQN